MEFIPRERLLQRLSDLLEKRRVTTMLGPRQCGKTTLARKFLKPNHENYFDLENPVDEMRLKSDPMLLGSLRGIVVIDEVQRNPKLFNLIRYLVDREENAARFLLLGSASPELRQSSSQTLAGRTGFLDLSGFDCSEIGWQNWRQLWLRGGFPESYLQLNDTDSCSWRKDFVRTFLERDIPQLGLRIHSAKLRSFWTVVAAHQGQTWNSSKIAQMIGVSQPTAKDYLGVLEQTFMLRTLQPYAKNVRKRVVKAPKVYFRDSGILHSLLNIHSLADLENHSGAGLSWEGFAIDQVVRTLEVSEDDIYYWATQGGAEIDLLVEHSTKGLLGFEFKKSSAPSTTKSMRIVLEDIQPEHIYVIYPGDKKYKLDEKITAIPLSGISGLVS